MTIRIDIEGVKFLVLDKFKTQREFAKAVGISEAAMSAIMKGDSTPSVGTVRRMAEALDVPEQELFFKVPQPLVALESDAVYVTHIGELARIQERGREILDGGDMSDFEALRSYQSIVLENLTVLSKVLLPTPGEVVGDNMEVDVDPLTGARRGNGHW